MHLIKYLSINLLLISSLYGCTDRHEPANCPPDCPDGFTSSSVEETDRYMMGKWKLFIRQISEDNATEMQGTITINNKVSPGLYSGSIKGKARFMKFERENWDCSGPKSPTTISCSKKELIEIMDWKVKLGMSTDGIKLDFSSPNGELSVFMDIHEDHIGRTIGKKFKTGEETYLMGKIINGTSPLDAMDLRAIKLD